MSDVFINGVWHCEEILERIERQYGLRIPPGRYWYDAASGLAGLEGQGTAGRLPAGMDLGGPLPANISEGWTGIFLNGRQLTLAEVAYLTLLTGGVILPGRYWLDALGNAGREGGPMLVNLYQLAQPRGSGGSGRTSYAADGWVHSNPATGVSASGDGHNIMVSWPGGSYCGGD
jgi:hypothetical protein